MSRFAAVLALSALLPAAAVAQDRMQWVYSSSIGETPLQTYLGLAYGIPQTDAVQMLATCAIGANWIYADVLLAAGVEGLADDSPVTVTAQGNGFSAAHEATVYRAEEGIWGVRVAVPLDDALWSILSGPERVIYGVQGQPPLDLETRGARSAILAFQNDCEHIGDLRPPPAKR